MRPVGIHTAWWRYPGGYPDANFNFEHLAHFARRLEAAKFDAFFMADHLAVMNMPVAALRRSATVTSFDPLTLLPALAVLTERIGLIATASTTYNEPYHVARKFASLDHISKGRAGWNLVTSGNPDEALNFGRDAHLEHATRYARAREFFDVVTGLWDSFADDAFTMDPASGLFLDPAKMHVLDHRGDFLKVKGPLNVARPVQGWPVIVQAGASEAGKQIAAETAEMVFGAGSTLEAAQAFYADVKGRMPAAGRDRTSSRSCPAASSSWARRRTRRGPRRRASTTSSIPTAASPTSRSASASTRRASTSTRRCRSSPRATPARAGRPRSSTTPGARRDRAGARPQGRRLRRPADGRHARAGGRPDGGMAGDARLRRFST